MQKTMRLINRYLLSSYFKVLILCLLSFITALLVSRMKEIVEFAAMGANGGHLALFTLFQIPYILPIALPISCLISSILLFKALSEKREITAFRSLGISLKRVILPVLAAASFLSVIGFYITSELASQCHLASRKMMYDLSSVNPLLLLQSAKIAQLKGSFIQMSPVEQAKEAKDFILTVRGERLHLCLAKKLKLKDSDLFAENVSLVGGAPGPIDDHLVIENQKAMRASAPEFSKMLRNKGYKLGNDYLKFRFLKVRYTSLMEEIKKETNPKNKLKLIRSREKCKSEIVRRISLAQAPLSFSLLGIASGLEISRRERKRGVFYALFLTAIALISFFLAKEFDHRFILSSMLYVLPHFGFVSHSLIHLKKINQGIE